MLDRRLEDRAINEEGLTPADLIMVEEETWLAQLGDIQENINTVFQRYLPMEGETAEVGEEHVQRRQLALQLVDRLSRVAAKALGGFVPDIIITWTPAPFLRKLFPEALILHRESGVFARPPYPEAFPLDPCGHYARSWPARFRAASASAAALDETRRLREFFAGVFKEVELIPERPELLKSFKRSILVAGQVSHFYSYDANCAYRSQMHMLEDVLKHAPPDCAVIYVQHPDTPQPMRENEIAWMRSRYPNFIPERQFKGSPSLSQQLLHVVDAVATVTSTVGWQSVFWGKPLIALGNGQFNAYAQAESAEAIPRVLQQAAPDTLANAAWLAFHYCIPETYLRQAGWLSSYLRDRLEHWRKRGAEGYFAEPYGPPAQVANDYIELSRETFPAFWGSPLDGIEDEQELDFADSQRFGAGWSFCEGVAPKNHRWIEGREAVLRLALNKACAFTLSLNLSTHARCPEQTVEVFVGAQRTGSAAVAVGKSTILQIEAPKTLVTEPLTPIRLRMTQAAAPLDGSGQPTEDIRELSVACGRIWFRVSTC